MANVMIAPATSYYARTPSDMRCMRETLRSNSQTTVTAVYIGCAYGDDFFSWYPIAWGLGVHVAWTVVDIRDECVKFCQHHAPAELPGWQGDFNSGTSPIHGFDYMIANRVWTTDVDYNRSGLKRLFEAKPGVLFTRGHYHTGTQFAELAAAYGYHVYTHTNQKDDVSTGTQGMVAARPEVNMDWTCAHTKLERVNVHL